MDKPKVDVTVRVDHKFRGKRRTKGETIAVTNREAKMLAALGYAVAKRRPAKLLEAPPAVAEEERPKRTYKRRDVAEAPLAVVLQPAAPEPIAAPLPDAEGFDE